jgi:xanthine dehydrogenase accessory factor
LHFGQRTKLMPSPCTASPDHHKSAQSQAAFDEVDRRIEGYALPVEEAGERYVVVSTQGRGDEAALLAAFAVDPEYLAFVGQP